jgi:hypothetical protein
MEKHTAKGCIAGTVSELIETALVHFLRNVHSQPTVSSRFDSSSFISQQR